MPSVNEMIGDILRREGGYVNHPADRGGPTNYGITQRTLSGWLGRPASVEEVRTLDEATAREIYERNYLAGPRIDTLPDRVVPFVFDGAVNHGPRRAVMLLQSVINQAGFGPVSEDGLIGPKTRTAVEKADAEMQDWLLAALVEERRNFYRRIVAASPSQQVFLRGWLNRLNEFDVEVAA